MVDEVAPHDFIVGAPWTVKVAVHQGPHDGLVSLDVLVRLPSHLGKWIGDVDSFSKDEGDEILTWKLTAGVFMTHGAADLDEFGIAHHFQQPEVQIKTLFGFVCLDNGHGSLFLFLTTEHCFFDCAKPFVDFPDLLLQT